MTAAIDLDMPMLLYDFTDVVAYGAGHSTLEGVFEKAGAAMGVKLSPDPMPEQAIFVRSDHYAMVEGGRARGHARDRHGQWRRGGLGQVPRQQLSPAVGRSLAADRLEAGAKFAELNYRVVRELADAATRAQWYSKDYFGDLFAPTAAKVPRPAQ